MFNPTIEKMIYNGHVECSGGELKNLLDTLVFLVELGLTDIGIWPFSVRDLSGLTEAG